MPPKNRTQLRTQRSSASSRMLSVPTEVCADGNVFMGSHFRIAMKGLLSPRMHYHDDAINTGKVYVGYIGKHLPNKQTN